jgi:hypothetical protein
VVELRKTESKSGLDEYFEPHFRQKQVILSNKSGLLAQQVAFLPQKWGKAWEIRGQTRQGRAHHWLKIGKDWGAGAPK